MDSDMARLYQPYGAAGSADVIESRYLGKAGGGQ
jgi:hypothetical protein